jgi:hypothetical protein
MGGRGAAGRRALRSSKLSIHRLLPHFMEHLVLGFQSIYSSMFR